VANFSVKIKSSAAKELEQLPKKDLQRVVARIRQLAVQPRPHGSEKLSGQERYRARQGNYRVVYEVSDDDRVVTIVKIGHRREVYR
jgi:mRNA interferase RelE/StbE